MPLECAAQILVSGLSPAHHEVYYLLDLGTGVAKRCEVRVNRYANAMASHFASRIERSQIPYGLVEFDAIPPNFMQPHEGLRLCDDTIAVAMHNAPYLRLLNFERHHVGNFPDTERFVPEMLSATNHVAPHDKRLYFSSTPLDQRLARYTGETRRLETTLKSCSQHLDDVRELATVSTAEAIHEVKIADVAGTMLAMMTEFQLVTRARPPLVNTPGVLDDPSLWRSYEAAGLHESHLYVHDIARGHTLRWGPAQDTPGHVELSLVDRSLVYLSCHNLSKACGKLWLHGRGRLVQLRLSRQGGVTTHKVLEEENLLRVTSHKVFRYRGRSLVAVTVYPNMFYLIEDPTMDVVARRTLFEHPPIPPDRLHRCDLGDHMPLWIETSDNGRFVILCSNEVIYLYDLETEALTSYRGYTRHGPIMITAHITNLSPQAEA